MKKLIILLFLIGSVVANAQKKDPEQYDYPFESYYQPLKIRTNIVLLYRAEGDGNFDLNDPEQKSVFNDYLQNINHVYSNFVKPADLTNCYNGNDFIPDARLRFDFNIIQVVNAYAWDYLNSGAEPENGRISGFSPTENWYIAPLNDSIFNAPDIPKGINAYFTSNGKKFDELERTKGENYDLAGKAASQLPTDRNLFRSSQTHQPDRYLKFLLHKYQAPSMYNTDWKTTRSWHVGSRGASHEFGHSLGLSHSNEYHRTNACKYSLMSQTGNAPRNWLPPTEIKKMHWNLTRTNLMQFVTPESAYGALWKLDEDTEWDKPRRFYHNFELAKNKTLVVSDSIILPPQAYFKLNKNSKILFKGKGKIVDANGREFKNYEKHRRAQILRE